jgi:hypothetical protein
VKERLPENIRSRLVRFARDEVKAAVKRAKIDREGTVHIEEDLPETPTTEQVSTLGDEILDFYQPDEDLKVEDVVPDIEVPPPDAVAKPTSCGGVSETPSGNYRRTPAVRSRCRYIVGLRDKDLANSLRKPEAEVQRLLDSARTHLHQGLIASGCTLKATDPAPSRV